MNRAELESYATRLEGTGIRFVRGERDGSGNLTRLVEVPWDAALVQIVRLTGWRVVEETDDAPTVIPLRVEP